MMGMMTYRHCASYYGIVMNVLLLLLMMWWIDVSYPMDFHIPVVDTIRSNDGMLPPMGSDENTIAIPISHSDGPSHTYYYYDCYYCYYYHRRLIGTKLPWDSDHS